MTGSRASLQAALGNLAEYYHWEETDRGIRIYMHSAAVDRLQAEVLRAAESGPHGGSTEIGGILLGRAEEDQGRPVTVIDSFVPVPCSGGPHYDLSGEDTVNLEAALLRVALAGCESPDAPAILGYYRSHTREGLSLSPADLQTIDSYFQAPASVFMLVKAVAGNQACTAGFFFWDDGRIQSEFSSLEVALGRTLSSVGPDRETAGEVAPLPPDLPDRLNPEDANAGLPGDLVELFRKAALAPPSTPPALEPEPPARTPAAAAAPAARPGKPARAWPGLLLRAATILIAASALVISVVTYLGAPKPAREEGSASPRAASVLGLQVERNPPDLLVIWNRNAREIAAARRATLFIRDGRAERSLDLDGTQLARGSFLYSPSSDDILFRLEVFGTDDGSVAQSIRVLNAR